MAIDSDGFGTTFGDRTNAISTAPARAAQQDWYVSFATGDDANDGTVGSPLKTPAEWSNRVERLISTSVGTPILHILDTDPITPPNIIVSYKRLPLGVRLLGYPATILGSPSTVTTWRGENAATPAARAITTAGADWNLYTNGSGQLPRVRCPSKNAVCWGGAIEAPTRMRVSPPYAALATTPQFTQNLPTLPTELVNGDTIVVETLPIIDAVTFNGEIPSYQTLMIENLETNGGNQAFSSFQDIRVSGSGTAVYLNCGIGGASLQDSSVYVGCRIDNFAVYSTSHSMYGCLLFWSMEIFGGTLVLGDCLSAAVDLHVFAGQVNFVRPVGIFDSTLFSTEGALIAASSAASIIIDASLYGNNNVYAYYGKSGGSLSWTSGNKPVHLVGETSNVRIDGVNATWAATTSTIGTSGSKAVPDIA